MNLEILGHRKKALIFCIVFLHIVGAKQIKGRRDTSSGSWITWKFCGSQTEKKTILKKVLALTVSSFTAQPSDIL